jgi:hypothetical protein
MAKDIFSSEHLNRRSWTNGALTATWTDHQDVDEKSGHGRAREKHHAPSHAGQQAGQKWQFKGRARQGASPRRRSGELARRASGRCSEAQR